MLHVLANFQPSFYKRLHTMLARQTEAQISGCESPCREANTRRHQERGTRGRCIPVEVEGEQSLQVGQLLQLEMTMARIVKIEPEGSLGHSRKTDLWGKKIDFISSRGHIVRSSTFQ